MSTTTIDGVKSRIRKLLNLAADDAAAQGEIENAVAAAQKLMDAHHIAETDLAEKEAGTTEIAETTDGYKRRTAYGGGDGRSVKWEGWLANAVTRAVGGIGCYLGGARAQRSTTTGFAKGTKRVGTYVFYGAGEEVDLGAELFAQLQLTIASMAVGLYGNCYRGVGRSYAEGFVAGISAKLREAENIRKRSELTSSCTALATTGGTTLTQIVARKKELAESWLSKSEGIKLGKGSNGRGGAHDGDAYGRGKADGRRADLSVSRRPRLGGGSSRRLGA